jgi:hypothetical protein
MLEEWCQMLCFAVARYPIPFVSTSSLQQQVNRVVNHQVNKVVSYQVKRALFCPSSSTMAAQDVILLLLPVQLHDCEHKQVMPTPTSLRTLSKQLYYGSSKSDVPSVTLPCVQQEQLVIMPAPTAPTSPRTLSKQLYYGSTKCDVPFVTFPCVQQQQLVMPAPTSPRILLAKQLFYGSTRCDSHSASCPIA